MHTIDARALDFQALNQQLREGGDACAIINCCGQRFIAAGMAGKSITIDGVPGNALGAYLNGASVTVRGNAQDAVGDTMNEGEIIVHGGIGDAAGYAMRGGRILIRDGAGYRAGIHMKAYKDKVFRRISGRRRDCRARSERGRQTHCREFSLHGYARREAIPAREVREHPLPRAGPCRAGRRRRACGGRTVRRRLLCAVRI